MDTEVNLSSHVVFIRAKKTAITLMKIALKMAENMYFHTFGIIKSVSLTPLVCGGLISALFPHR